MSEQFDVIYAYRAPDGRVWDEGEDEAAFGGVTLRGGLAGAREAERACAVYAALATLECWPKGELVVTAREGDGVPRRVDVHELAAREVLAEVRRRRPGGPDCGQAQLAESLALIDAGD